MDMIDQKKLLELCSGIPADIRDCTPYLRRGETFLFGLYMNDPAANYRWLNPFDLMALSPSQRVEAAQTRRSPYTHVLLIFYQETGDPHIYFKVINGMVSGLFPVLNDLFGQTPPTD